MQTAIWLKYATNSHPLHTPGTPTSVAAWMCASPPGPFSTCSAQRKLVTRGVIELASKYCGRNQPTDAATQCPAGEL